MMTTQSFSGWKKSSRSGSAGDNCVEVATAVDGTIGIRDSKDPHGPVLAVASSTWQSFAAGLKTSQFDSH
jgi:Domain of unknown function (DUF397)